MSSQSPSVRHETVSEDHANQRIDNWLVNRLKGVPKSRIYRLLRKGEVRVNKSRVKPEYKLQPGDLVRIPPVRMSEGKPAAVPGTRFRSQLEQAIIFEDDALMVVDKPSGMAVHGGSGVNLGVIEGLRAMYPDHQFLELVHRLDRDTSGCLLVAKKRSALKHLQRQLAGSGMDKRYLALVKGRWEKGRETVSAPLRKNQLQSGERIVRVDRDGKPSVTHFRIQRKFSQATLVAATLETGRTHQIRVHCQSAGHPIAGDSKYGDDEFNQSMKVNGLNRLFLHAYRLAFDHPEGERLDITAPLPEGLETLLSLLEV
ncbi:MAG: 23S rRNA pseudouridine(955/2504/2580) synthase RluC [bacterium]